MTATDPGTETTTPTNGNGTRFTRPQRLAIQAVMLLGLLSITRIWTGFDNLTSSGTAGAALRLTVPDPARRSGRPLVRSRRRGQHRH